MNKYKEGDRFQATLEITEVYIDEDEISFKVVELDTDGYGSGLLEEYYTHEEVDRAFDPNYKERKRLQKIRELEEELEGLRNE